MAGLSLHRPLDKKLNGPHPRGRGGRAGKLSGGPGRGGGQGPGVTQRLSPGDRASPRQQHAFPPKGLKYRYLGGSRPTCLDSEAKPVQPGPAGRWGLVPRCAVPCVI